MARAPIKKLPSQQMLRKLLDYNPDTGVLTWKVQRQCVAAGSVAGAPLNGHSYIVVVVNGCGYLAHRLIWKWMTGRDPKLYLDHVDGNKINNRWGNLREADHAQNKHNTPLQSNNKSGVKGVHWNAKRKKWEAQIKAAGRHYALGRFSSKDAAIAAVSAKRQELHGPFARSN